VACLLAGAVSVVDATAFFELLFFGVAALPAFFFTVALVLFESPFA
jgi:hypothetical protein